MSATSAASSGARLRSLTCVIASVTLATLNYGLTFPLLALILERQGIDKSLIGFSTAATAMATIAAAPISSRLMSAIGPRRLLLGAMALSALIYILLPTFLDYWAWFPLRFVLGCCGSVIWVASEAWINSMAPEEKRGRVIAIYATASSGGMALGPLLLLVTGSSGFAPFIVAASFSLAGCLVTLLAGHAVPRLDGRPSTHFLRFLLLAPMPFLLNLLFAAVGEAFHTFFAIYALDHGTGEQRAFMIMTVMSLGGIALQYPFGWLADHMNRRLLLLLCVMVSIGGFLIVPFAISADVVGLVLFFVAGGIFAALYSFGVIMLGERFAGTDLATASAVFTLMWGLGTLSGPVIAGAAMDHLGPRGLIWTAVVFLLLFLPIPAVAWIRSLRRGAAAVDK
jgi:MFS family permease